MFFLESFLQCIPIISTCVPERCQSMQYLVGTFSIVVIFCFFCVLHNNIIWNKHFGIMSFAPSSSSTSSEPASKVRKIENGVEYFPTVPKIEYAGPESVNPLSYRYYNPNEILLGKPMKDWLRFSVCFWHTVSITDYLQLVTPININSKHVFTWFLHSY